MPAETLERVLAMRQVCQRYDVHLAHAAVQYVLRHPAVTAVVIGAGSAREVQETPNMRVRLSPRTFLPNWPPTVSCPPRTKLAPGDPAR